MDITRAHFLNRFEICPKPIYTGWFRIDGFRANNRLMSSICKRQIDD